MKKGKYISSFFATIQRNKQKYKNKNKKGGSFFALEQFFDKQAKSGNFSDAD